MKKKQSVVSRTVSSLKKGAAAVFVCAILLSPVIMMGLQARQVYSSRVDHRKTIEIADLAVRPIDRSADLKPFEQPIITVTFDDGWETIYTNGLPLLQKYGIPTTQYVMSGTFDQREYLTRDQLKSFQRAGHEIGCHTIDHSDLTTLLAADVDKQLGDCRRDLEKLLGRPVRHFASPYGSSNPATIAAIKRVYDSQRNTAGDIASHPVGDEDINLAANFDRYNIIAITLRRDTTVAQLQAAIDYTVRTNGWLVLNYHDVRDGESEFGLDTRQLEAQLQAISRSQARIVTMGQFLDTYNQRGRQ